MEDEAGRPTKQPAGESADAASRAEADAAAGAAEEVARLEAAEATEPTTFLLSLEGRSPRPQTCPFFRSIEDDGSLHPPFEYADPSNRCAAFGEPRPQSTRQQELVCLQRGHVDCPRYLRGALVAPDPLVPAVRVRPSLAIPPATLAASLILAASAVVSVGFVIARGGLEMPVAAVETVTPAPSPTEVAVASRTPDPTPTPTPTPQPSPSPVPSPSPSPEPSASPSPLPSPTAVATPQPSPTSDRYRLLDPCPDQPDCWIYVVRSGDNLYSIGQYFGHRLQTLYDWNPGLEGSSLKPGRKIRMPPPTK